MKKVCFLLTRWVNKNNVDDMQPYEKKSKGFVIIEGHCKTFEDVDICKTMAWNIASNFIEKKTCR